MRPRERQRHTAYKGRVGIETRDERGREGKSPHRGSTSGQQIKKAHLFFKQMDDARKTDKPNSFSVMSLTCFVLLLYNFSYLRK